MKLKYLSGWELMEQLNTEKRTIGGLNYYVHDHNRRRAAMKYMQHKRTIKEDESSDPQTGIYFWAPRVNKSGKIFWTLQTFFDRDFPAHDNIELDHATIWKQWAGTILGKNDPDESKAIRNNYSGIPRGRVTVARERSYPGGPSRKVFYILHGNDSPFADIKTSKLIASNFHLPDGSWKFVYDNHERMIRSDIQAVQRHLGINLGLTPKAAKFN